MKLVLRNYSAYPYLFILCTYIFLYSFCTEVNSSNIDYLVFQPIQFGQHILVITALVSILFLMNISKCKFDVVFLFLIVRFFLLLIPFLYFDGSSTLYFGSLATNLVVALIYISFKDRKEWISPGLKLILVFGLILSIETLISLVFGEYSWNLTYFKFMFGIPIGKSNYIGCFILPVFELLFLDVIDIKNKIIKVIFLMIMAGAIIATKSRGTWLILSIFILISYYNSMREKNKNKYTINAIVLLIVLILIFNYEKVFDGLSSVLLGNFESISSQYSIFDRLTSMRSSVNGIAFEHFLEYPLFGNGPVYLSLSYRAHNLFIDILYQSGIIGSLLYFASLLVINRRTKKSGLTRVGRKVKLVLILMVVHAMIEPSLLMFPVDFIFWILICILLNEKVSKPKL